MNETLYTFKVLYIVFAVCIVTAWCIFLWNNAKDEDNNDHTGTATN